LAEVFVDTAGWASAFVNSQPFHSEAAGFIRRWRADGTRIVTTNFVLAELSALLISPLRVSRKRQVLILETLRISAWVQVVHIDSALDAAAFELFTARPDKAWTIVDCSSFVVMKQRGILEALTSDRHFDQAGFSRLLK
jgi:uncharacterized protein